MLVCLVLLLVALSQSYNFKMFIKCFLAVFFKSRWFYSNLFDIEKIIISMKFIKNLNTYIYNMAYKPIECNLKISLTSQAFESLLLSEKENNSTLGTCNSYCWFKYLFELWSDQMIMPTLKFVVRVVDLTCNFTPRQKQTTLNSSK